MTDLQVTIDNFGRRVVKHGGCTFYLTADGRVMRQWDEPCRPEKDGRVFTTTRHKVERSRFADRVRAALSEGKR